MNNQLSPTENTDNSANTTSLMGITIQNFAFEYLDSLYDCNHSIFPVKYSAKFYRDIADKLVTCKIVLKNETVIANVAYRVDSFNNSLYLMTFGCLPEYRRHGIGTLLMKSVDEQLAIWNHMHSVTLHVQCNNRGALKFYSKCGFFIEGVEQKYYTNIEPPDAFHLYKLNPYFALNFPPARIKTLILITTEFIEYIDKFPQNLDDPSLYNCTINKLHNEILKASTLSFIDHS